MKRSRILFSLLRIPLDIATLSIGFLIARNIRATSDGIPWIHLPKYVLGYEDLFLYVLVGVMIFLVIEASRNMYRLEIRSDASNEITQFLGNTFLWFLIFIGIVYLSMGFSVIQELPRLIIFFAMIFHVILGAIGRILLVYTEKRGIEKNIFPRERLLVIGDIAEELAENPLFFIIEKKITDPEIAENIRNHTIDAIFFSGNIEKGEHIAELIELAKIYGIPTLQAIIPGEFSNIPREIIEWNGIAVVNFSAVTITPGERLLKRISDVFLSLILLVLLFPFFLIIGICIKLEDPSGPIIFRNRRVGLDGTFFTLYKFRYMYWKYSVKDAYGEKPENDPALQYEMELREKQSSRKGPLYKVTNDPRMTKVGKLIEKFSIDELPQLWNVFVGNMSFVGPRAHQPREVEQYEEYQNQVLTIKPGITGMAQVHGRDQNSFEDEVKLDIYYIEHYSLWLDIVIFFRTFFVVIERGFSRTGNAEKVLDARHDSGELDPTQGS